MQNDSCFLKKINFLVLFCVILLHGFNAFPQAEKNKTKIEKNSFEQKIQWEQDENASEYKVEIRDIKSGKKYYFETEENFVNLNLPASRYEYQVTVLNSFGRVQTASGWNSFEIFKAELPEIVKVQKKSVVPSKDDDFFIETDIKNVNEDSAVSLVNEKTATKVKFPKVENGEWKLIVENPLGQKTESASIQVVDQKTEEARIAAEKAERERLAKAEEEKRLAEEARIAEEKRLAEEAEAARALELARAEEERQLAQKQEEERRKKEEARIAAEKAERERLAKAEEEKRLAEEARIAEEKRLAEEAEAARALELARAEEERQLAQKQEEERRKAEEARIAAEKAEQERLAKAEEEKKLSEKTETVAEAEISEEEKIAAEPETKKSGKKEKRILGFYAAADGGLLFSPFFDEFSDGKAMPFLGLKLGFVPEIKKSNRIGIEIDSLVSKYELNTSNYDYSDKFAFLRMNLLYQRKIFRNALKLNVRAGGNLIFIQNFMDYKDSDNLKKDAAYGYLGVQGGSSLVFTAGNFLMEAGADYIFVFIDGMPTDFLSPYISLGIRW